MVKKTILDKYKDGCKVVRGEDQFYVELPNDERLEFGSSRAGLYRKPARLYAALRALFGQFPLFDERDKVPIEIAVAGKPAIVAYLYVAHYEYYHEEYGTRSATRGFRYALGEVVDVSAHTVTKYFRRVINDAESERVGGSGH